MPNWTDGWADEQIANNEGLLYTAQWGIAKNKKL